MLRNRIRAFRWQTAKIHGAEVPESEPYMDRVRGGIQPHLRLFARYHGTLIKW